MEKYINERLIRNISKMKTYKNIKEKMMIEKQRNIQKEKIMKQYVTKTPMACNKVRIVRRITIHERQD